MTKPLLLVVGAGPDQVAAIRMAREMGYRVAATDRDHNAPGFAFADMHALISTNDKEGNLGFAQQVGASGVMTLISETGVPVVSHVAARMGMPAPSEETAYLATNKNAMRAAFLRHGVPCPASAAVNTPEAVRDFARRYGFPLVIKPSDCSGQAGTTLIHTPEELVPALAAAVSFASDQWAIAEEYVAGPEINVCAVVIRGKAHILSLSDRITASPPHFGIAIRHALPALLSAEQYRMVSEVSLRAVKSIGLTDGIAYPQVLMGVQGPSVVEIAARIPGGNMREVALWKSGVDMVRIAIKQAMGESINLENERSLETYNAVAVEFITKLSVPENIRVIGEVRGMHEALVMPGVKELQFKLKKGDAIPALDSSRARFGSVVAVGDTLQEALERAAKAARHIEIIAE